MNYTYGMFVCFYECNSAIAKSGYSTDSLEPFIKRATAFLHNRIEPEYRKLSVDERYWIRAYLSLEQRILWDNLCVFFDRTYASGAGKLSTPDNPSKRLNDHDTALRNAQGELKNSRIRLNDHDTALRYAQEELETDKKRLNDHDTALRYAQGDLESSIIRLNDHDAALRYAQMEIAELRSIVENSLSRKISRIVLWLPRKIKQLLRRVSFAKE